MIVPAMLTFAVTLAVIFWLDDRFVYEGWSGAWAVLAALVGACATVAWFA